MSDDRVTRLIEAAQDVLNAFPNAPRLREAMALRAAIDAIGIKNPAVTMVAEDDRP